MASYWRLTSAIDRKVAEAVADVPDWMAEQVAQETRDTAYPEERRIWAAGMDRLCEIYGVPEKPDDTQPAQIGLGL